MNTEKGMSSGYYHSGYATSLCEFGTPVYLPACNAWIIKRPIPGTSYYDAMGCYPLFCCQNWAALESDIKSLKNDLVSLVLVTDPMANIDSVWLNNIFDHVYLYRHHFVVETGSPLHTFVSKSHQANARKALRKINVEKCENPVDRLDDWLHLFDVLASRHQIEGLRRFSADAFRQQLSLPGMVMFRSSYQQETVGLDLWYEQDNGAQGHLVAFNETGYKLSASYASKWAVLSHFNERVRWINLGGGQSMDGNDGLGFFKKGFANTTRPSWLCGKILQPDIYQELANFEINGRSTYFPAYRHGELIRKN